MTVALGSSGITVHPLCLGGNVFGWTADETASFAVLDAFVAAGGNFVDTADTYSSWVPGHDGGESERTLGAWLAARGNRESVVLATKGGGHGGLGAANLRASLQASLKRLGTDYVDLYYAHRDDGETPPAEVVGTLRGFRDEGLVRTIGLSNYAAPRLAEALAVSDGDVVAFQPKLNLLERDEFDDALRALCLGHAIAVFPYFGLASGFLTGKYARGAEGPSSGRAKLVRETYMNDRGFDVVEAVGALAAERGVSSGAVALAWLRAQPAVAGPIVSATSVAQLEQLLPALSLDLTESELARLDSAAAAPAPAGP